MKMKFMPSPGDELSSTGMHVDDDRTQQVLHHDNAVLITGVDICGSQIQLAGGVTLAALGLDEPGVNVPRGRAIQARVNMEQLQPDGTVRPSGGVITACKRINPLSSPSRCPNEAAQMTRPAARACASRSQWEAVVLA